MAVQFEQYVLSQSNTSLKKVYPQANRKSMQKWLAEFVAKKDYLDVMERLAMKKIGQFFKHEFVRYGCLASWIKIRCLRCATLARIA